MLLMIAESIDALTYLRLLPLNNVTVDESTVALSTISVPTVNRVNLALSPIIPPTRIVAVPLVR